MDSRKLLTAGEIEELKQLNREIQDCGGVWLDYQASKIVNALPRILSLLTPPPDAAVKEAVERLSRFDYRWGRDLGTTAVRVDDLHILLRAVQAPRPSSEQHRVVRIAVINADLRGDTEESEALRSAFPEAFAGEVGRG